MAFLQQPPGKSKDSLTMVIDALSDLLSDNTVPKNVKLKVENMVRSLKEPGEMSLKVNHSKVLKP
jgi:uncharacterized protein (UPF0147 family)